MMTGVRLSIGTAWLVIVAAEMLTGGTGLGFWLWDEWNKLNVQNILIAVLVIGVIGLILDLGLLALARRFHHSEACNHGQIRTHRIRRAKIRPPPRPLRCAAQQDWKRTRMNTSH